MSHSPAAQAIQGTGSGRRTMPTTRSPGSSPQPAGASTTTPSDSWPRTKRFCCGGGAPYSPARMSRSVPHIPSPRVLTSTAPSAGGGSATSSTLAEPATPGTVVNASMMTILHVVPRGEARRTSQRQAPGTVPARERASGPQAQPCGLPCVESRAVHANGRPPHGSDRTQALGDRRGLYSLAELVLRARLDLARDRLHL